MQNELGRQGEDIAALEYENLGYEIVGRNVRVHGRRQIGEIDLIAAKERELVFVEVKTRRSYSFGSGAEAVNYFKQRKLVTAAKTFLRRNRQYDHWDWRIDVVEVDIDNAASPAIILENVIEDLD
jgi:putative endonuclease